MKRGFTLVELLVVITIIGILSAMVVVATMSSKSRARDAKRKGDLTSIKTALELYRENVGSYPTTSGTWCGESGSNFDTTAEGCSYNVTNYGANAYIQNATNPFAPTYLAVLPRDPIKASGDNTYVYRSDGTSYKVRANKTVESTVTNVDSFYDATAATPAHSYQVSSDATALDW